MKNISDSDWCMSSFASGNNGRFCSCPSNVDKSMQPCPRLPSTSLISKTNNDNNPIISSSSLLFSSKKKEANKGTTYVLSSLLEHPDDYYPNKRIEQLHHRMDEIQISSFLKFINYHLSFKSSSDKKYVQNLAEDLSNGHILIDLIEIFSSTKLKREYGRTRFHSLTNVQYVLDYLKSHMQHINISPHDIVSGNRKQILALLWIIMKIFDFPSFHINTNKYLFLDRNLNLLQWINNLLKKILNLNQIFVQDFSLQTWIDNIYLLLIIKYISPLSKNYGSLEYFDYLKQFDENHLTNLERLKLSLKFSNYCFDLESIVDFNDRTDKCLRNVFVDLQEKIFSISKSNQIINPYIKQLVETTTNAEKIDEDYLILNDNPEEIIENDTIEEISTILEDRLSTSRSRKSSPSPINTHSHLPSNDHAKLNLLKFVIIFSVFSFFVLFLFFLR